MNPVIALTLAAMLAIIGHEVYQSGQESQAKADAQTISDLTSARNTAKDNAESLEQALSDANAKVRQFEADRKADLEKKAVLQELAKVEAEKGKVRVQAAKAVTTNSDDVLRAYWGSYGQ
jgi:predicted  nucleic acid-binding Zn-ribbon protein